VEQLTYLRQKASPLTACPQPPSRSEVASGGGRAGGQLRLRRRRCVAGWLRHCCPL